VSKFKAMPTRLPETAAKVDEVARFAKAAQSRSLDLAPATAAEKDAKPTNGINLRLNDYELELIRQVAKLHDRSIQKTIKRILIPALEQELERHHTGT